MDQIADTSQRPTEAATPVPAPRQGPAPSILIIDDSLINRKKIRGALRRLGHNADLAEDGESGLQAVRAKPYDVILLDIVMPGIDGFAVLEVLKADPALRDIPVIVISSLEDEQESVVHAIELGAEDFLPKNFDPILLRARLNASLTKKTYRDQEQEYLRRVERLTQAALVVETGRFKPETLGLEELRSHKDALGKLAAVFSGMAGEIYRRELRLRKAIHAIQGILLVIFVGVVWGATPALSRLAANAGASPLILATWVNAFAAIMYLSISAARGQLAALRWRHMGFLIIWTVIAAILQRVVMLVLAGNVEATLLALVAAFQVFIVFAISSVIRLEKANLRRLTGLMLGMIGVCVVLFDKLDLSGGPGAEWLWLGLSLVLPALYATEWVFVAARKPAELDLLPAIGLVMLMSTLVLAPSAFVFEGGLLFSNGFGETERISLLLCAVASLSIISSYKLIELAGPVFASQSAYAMTICGIGWGMLLLGETLSAAAWIAVAFIFAGFVLVSPKPDNTEIVIKRSFTD
ncbi:response regulator [Dinoroseobacter sp. S375]|uniref:response regulator n=1 Tax=Dinoroseobacter sp. S375 TaxID=3415136 RepID=UPI003C7C77B7